MAESDKTEHISESIMERFCMRALTENELTMVAGHLTGCPDCQAEFVSTLRRQREVTDLSFTLAPEFWLRHEHLDYDQLVDLGDDKLDAADRELIDVHLKICPPCREDVRSFLAFREQIAPEMRVSYAPVEKESAREWLSWVSWWDGRTWKPVYSAALVVIGIALVIGAALLLNRRAENQQAQQVPTPQGSPSSTPDNRAADVPSPPATPNESPIEKPTSAEAIVVLNDRGGPITLDKNGNVAGLDNVPVPTRNDIAKMLLSEKIERPSILRELGGQGGGLRGSNSAMMFKLISPARTVVISDRPTFRWEYLAGATEYRVFVTDSNGHKMVESGELPPTHTEWTPTVSLKRGEIYTWAVIAIVDSQEIVSPGPAAPEIKFQVLPAIHLRELKQLNRSRSHLALGFFYARVGLMAQAEYEFRQLVGLNPKSKATKNLLLSVQGQR
jgi:hypothetical protein